jgi:Leucine-rich repeat (LRR) protein
MRNKIAIIEENAFANLKNLRTLNVHDNKLNVFSSFLNNMAELRNISIAQNNLSVFRKEILRNNKKIEYIWLDNNAIKHLKADTFDGMVNLIYVNLRNNTCINDDYYKEAFQSMKNKISENC